MFAAGNYIPIENVLTHNPLSPRQVVPPNRAFCFWPGRPGRPE
ncbi:Hypothetical protein GbCGDNIH9_8633 [Granulibacter bethesdensis]|uniref:Uncharacterized protein n=1 Tax=Granulibacter bethesdensis TaxID=364410 RepID=A0AAC9KF51_9PROT|nr:Hypothetical protein GbCGDNIH9_8633 [Granulibacter bethesdensis]APH62636.1 Hypothetical protein GbCGDNIH8_8633 [Granulibacter bethesdensis]